MQPRKLRVETSASLRVDLAGGIESLQKKGIVGALSEDTKIKTPSPSKWEGSKDKSQ